jgi:sterol desaturase/sphingolipid hydroxylase (fatty acid hydroxylase superfamily)
MALWEGVAPARKPTLSKALRWANNLGLVAFNTVLLRLLMPAAAVGMAVFAEQQGWGLLNSLDLPSWLAVIVAVAALDFIVWLQHVMMHTVPWLWRLHRVHHADPDYDLTTGARFHPLEILLSMLIKVAAIAALGPPAVAVIVFEVLLNAMAMFNHANVHLPDRLDRWLRWFVVTPDMHRIHHSVEPDEMNVNFGFNLPWWDRLLGTYRLAPRGGCQGMVVGIRGFTEVRDVTWLPGLLAMPLRNERHV